MIQSIMRVFSKRPRKPIIQPTSRLSFVISELPSSEKVEEIGLKIPRSIVKIGNAYYYLLNPGSATLSQREESIAGTVKASVIERASSNSEKSSSFVEIEEIAKSELLKYMPQERAFYIAQLIAHDTIGSGPISILLEDKQNIEEIEVNSPIMPISIYHARYGRCQTNMRFADEYSFVNTINRFIISTEKELNDENPIIDTQVNDARLHAQIKPYVNSGAAATIRVGGKKDLNISTLLKNGTVNEEVLAYLWLAIESNLNIVIAGAPASGKTTLLNAILSFVPKYNKIITIEEDINEIKFYQNAINVVSLYGSKYNGAVATKEQVINALRMRPDRLVVGEIRAEETKELFAGANLGIPFMTTMHSNEDGLSLLKKLLVKPMAVDPNAVSALDISIFIAHIGITRRMLSEIYEYKWLSRAESENTTAVIDDSNAVEILKVVGNGAINPSSLQKSKVINAYSLHNGISKNAALREFKARQAYINRICKDTDSTLEIISRINAYKAIK
ncbi:MAG: type II/IV secretion system ATPase subunit [Candidatus Micrarchaeaceae archaeon]